MISMVFYMLLRMREVCRREHWEMLPLLPGVRLHIVVAQR